MKNKIIIALTILAFAINTASAESYFSDKSYYTGESYFTAPGYIEKNQVQDNDNLYYTDNSRNNETGGTTPPLKQLRQTIQRMNAERKEKSMQLAPVMEDNSIYNSDTETSDFASKEQKEEFDENMMPDGFEADAQAVEEVKK